MIYQLLRSLNVLWVNNMEKINKQFLIGTSMLFFFLMLLDAHITSLIGSWDKNTKVWQSQLLLLVMLFAVSKLSKRFMISAAILIGILLDLYFLGIIGIYAVGLPLVVWVMYLFHSLFYQSLTNLFFSWVISLTLLQIITIGLQLGFKLAKIDGEFFVVNFFAPTLLLNIGYFLVFLWPLKKLYQLNRPVF